LLGLDVSSDTDMLPGHCAALVGWLVGWAIADELFRSLTADTKPADLERSLLARIGKRGSGGFDATFDRDGPLRLFSTSKHFYF